MKALANNGNHPFIAVDWGTSSFRAALIAPNGEVLDELSTPRGILVIKPDEFVPYLVATCERFTKNEVAAGGKMFLLSGMIGSKNGLLEVPYCPCPATASDIAASLGWVDTGNADLKIAIVPAGSQVIVFGSPTLPTANWSAFCAV